MRAHDPSHTAPQPRIIPRSEHTVSRKDISLEALKVLYRLHHAGYKAYLVGGGVRDLLLGKRPKDFDVVTDARPGELKKLLRNSRIIGRRFRLVKVFFRGGYIVEVSTFRRRSEFEADPDAPEADEPARSREQTYGTPAEDAQRRDLTVNGLFYNIADFSLVDYVGGLEDLQSGRIRVIGEPAVRFTRDPVRMLRVLRHAARLGFDIDREAWEEIGNKKQLIRLCPAARVRDELLKDFHSGATRPFMELMLASGLFYAIFPVWESRLRREGEVRLLDLCARVDLLFKAEVPLADSLLWAVFLTPYLEQGPGPANPKEIREFLQEEANEAFLGSEIPRQRQEELVQILALAEKLAPVLRQRRAVPVRLSRLAAYPEAWLYCQLKEASPEDLVERCRPEEIPPRALQPKRRRPRRRRSRNRGPRRITET